MVCGSEHNLAITGQSVLSLAVKLVCTVHYTVLDNASSAVCEIYSKQHAASADM